MQENDVTIPSGSYERDKLWTWEFQVSVKETLVVASQKEIDDGVGSLRVQLKSKSEKN